MLRALQSLEKPKHKRCFVVFVRGYFGDGDEYFTNEVSSNDKYFSADVDKNMDKEDYIEAFYKAYQCLKDSWVECRSHLPEEYQPYIKGASWDDDILPSGINELTLLYYDNLGHQHDVEIINV